MNAVPGPHRHLAVPDGGRGGRDRVRASSASGIAALAGARVRGRVERRPRLAARWPRPSPAISVARPRRRLEARPRASASTRCRTRCACWIAPRDARARRLRRVRAGRRISASIMVSIASRPASTGAAPSAGTSAASRRVFTNICTSDAVPGVDLGERGVQAFVGVGDARPRAGVGRRVERGPVGRAGAEQRLLAREVAVDGRALDAGLLGDRADRRPRRARSMPCSFIAASAIRCRVSASASARRRLRVGAGLAFE